MRRRALVLAVVLLCPALSLTACSDGDGKLHARATFTDVADLATGAPVMMSDITIGKVTGIALDRTGRKATVKFEVDRTAEVPADVRADVRRTSALGEKFIALTPRTKAADRAGAPLMKDGAVIRHAGVVSDLEQLVASGTATFEALSASQIAVLLDEGSKAFGGKGKKLNEILSDLSTVTHGYRSRTDAIRNIVDDLNQLGGDLAPKVEANGKALENTNETLAILNANDERFFELVQSLNRLADDGNRILRRHLVQIRTQLRGLRGVTDAVSDEQIALAEILVNLPLHNRRLPSGVASNFVQVLLDVVICGVPGGGDVPGDPVDACYPGEGS